jgi:hypothetical protein
MVQQFFEWMNQLPASQALSTSVWQFATIQALHLVSLGLFAGSVLIVDLRLLGLGARERPIAEVARDAQPWLILGLLALTVTGIPQLMQNAMREYASPYFWVKMAFLVTALVFTFTVRRKVTLADPVVGASGAKVVGFLSMALWLGVLIPARLIGLLS